MAIYDKPAIVHCQMDELWRDEAFIKYRKELRDARQHYLERVDAIRIALDDLVRETAVSYNATEHVYVGEGGRAMVAGIAAMIEAYREYVAENGDLADNTRHYRYVYNRMAQQDEHDTRVMWLCCTLMAKLEYFNQKNCDTFAEMFGVTYRKITSMYYQSRNYVGIFDIVKQAHDAGKPVPETIVTVINDYNDLEMERVIS